MNTPDPTLDPAISARLRHTASRRGQDENPVHTQALGLRPKLGDGAGPEHHAGRKGFVDEGLHGSLLQHGADDR